MRIINFPFSLSRDWKIIVEWNPREEILVEPLPHFKVIKDLIVDRSTFFKAYKFVEPVLKPSTPKPETEQTYGS